MQAPHKPTSPHPSMRSLFVLLLLVAACAAVPVRRGKKISVATEADSIEREDLSVPSAERHQLSVDDNGDSIEVRSNAPDGTEFKFEFEVEDKPKLSMKYEDGTGIETRLRIDFLELFRFEPSGDVTNGYTNETKTNVLQLDATAWTISCTDISADPTGVFTCVARSTGDVVILKTQVAGTRFIKNEVEVQPNQIKIQVVLNYPAAANEAIGFVLKLKSKTKYSAKEDNEGGEVRLGATSIFDWETEFLDQNGVAHPVIASDLVSYQSAQSSPDDEDDDKDFKKIYTFASLGVEAVNWDPVFGAAAASSSASLSTGAIVGIAAGGACGLVLVIVIVAAIMKKRSNRATSPAPGRVSTTFH